MQKKAIKVDKATDELNAAIKALVKNGNQAGSQNGSATPTVTKKAEQLRMDQLPKEQVDQKPQRQVIRQMFLAY